MKTQKEIEKKELELATRYLTLQVSRESGEKKYTDLELKKAVIEAMSELIRWVQS